MFDLQELLLIVSHILQEKQMIFVSERRDLISKVMFSLRDMVLAPTDLRWQCFFITCLPSILIESLNAPFPMMLGVVKSLFMSNLEDLQHLHSDSSQMFPTPTPVIVDIDSGKVCDLLKYRSSKKSTIQTPSFLKSICEQSLFDKIRKRDSCVGTI